MQWAWWKLSSLLGAGLTVGPGEKVAHCHVELHIGVFTTGRLVPTDVDQLLEGLAGVLGTGAVSAAQHAQTNDVHLYNSSAFTTGRRYGCHGQTIIQHSSQEQAMEFMVCSTSVTGPGHDQLNICHRMWSWWLRSVQRPSQDQVMISSTSVMCSRHLAMVVMVSSTSVTGPGHGDHGQFNVSHRTCSNQSRDVIMISSTFVANNYMAQSCLGCMRSCADSQ